MTGSDRADITLETDVYRCLIVGVVYKSPEKDFVVCYRKQQRMMFSSLRKKGQWVYASVHFLHPLNPI